MLGAEKLAQAPGSAAAFVFEGTELVLVTRRGPGEGSLSVQVDQSPSQTYDLHAQTAEPAVKLTLARDLPAGQHLVHLTSVAGDTTIDGFIVRRTPDLTVPLLLALTAAIGLTYGIIRRRLK